MMRKLIERIRDLLGMFAGTLRGQDYAPLSDTPFSDDRRALAADCEAVQRDLKEAVTRVKNEAGIITARCAAKSAHRLS